MTKHPFILNIETATDVCSVCLSKGEEVLSLEETTGNNEHSKLITVLIEECLNSAGLDMNRLDAVAVSSGPGSYTSLRVGLSAAKGICFAREIPLIAVDTLRALAWAAFQQQGDEEALYCPMIDARRMEVYCAMFDATNTPLTDVEAKIIGEGTFREYFSNSQKIIFAGNGAEKCQAVLSSELAVFLPLVCSATFLPYFANRAYKAKTFADLAYFVPKYLKAPNITKSKYFFIK